MGDLVKRQKTINLYGISEVQAKDVLEDIIKKKEADIKILTKEGEVQIVVSASADTEDEAKAVIKPVSREIKKRFPDSALAVNDKKNLSLEKKLVKLLEKNDFSISTAESCTGGLLSARIINVPGASEVFKEGMVTYTNKSKRKRLDVSKSTLKKYGAVSKQTAKEMAAGIAFNSDSDAALSITGIAGPDGGTEEKPVGLVYIGLYVKGKILAEEFHFSGNRQEIREQSVEAALVMLTKYLESI
jgi:competence/damage-inducible protein cinA C-terminal domain